MITCEICGVKVWLSDYSDHKVIDHDIAVPQWGQECPDCSGTGDDVRRHWEAEPGICRRCSGKGIL